MPTISMATAFTYYTAPSEYTVSGQLRNVCNGYLGAMCLFSMRYFPFSILFSFIFEKKIKI